MKKLFAALMAVMLVMSAGCSNSSESTSTTPDSTPAPEIVENTPAEDEEGSAPDEDEAAAPDEAAPEETPDEDAEGGFVETPAVKLTQAIVDCGVEMPMLMIIDDKEMLTEVMNYNLDIMDDYCIRTHMMSAQLVELTVIKPVAGKEQAVLDMLNARMEELKTTVAWYPDQIENAEATIVGSYNGYAYLICEKHSVEEEAALKKAIDELG